MATTMPPAVHLVDDEAPVRDALAFLFHSHGLAVRSYASGPDDPQPGDDVYDVRSLSSQLSLSGVPLRDW